MPSPAVAGIELGNGVAAILVGDPIWEPGPSAELDIDPSTGDLAIAERTPRCAVVPRWFWNGADVQVLAPISVRVAGYHPL